MNSYFALWYNYTNEKKNQMHFDDTHNFREKVVELLLCSRYTFFFVFQHWDCDIFFLFFFSLGLFEIFLDRWLNDKIFNKMIDNSIPMVYQSRDVKVNFFLSTYCGNVDKTTSSNFIRRIVRRAITSETLWKCFTKIGP